MKILNYFLSNQKIKMKLTLWICLLCITFASITLQEYPEYEAETPELIFNQIQHTHNIQHPDIQKLIFITPWNNEGKTLTRKYAHKLHYLSPCWYELTVKNNQIIFQNTQLHDQEYSQQIKSTNPAIKFLPRVYVSNFQVFQVIGSNSKQFQNLIILISNIIKNKSYDGIVWDSPYNTFIDQKRASPLNKLILELVNSLGSAFNQMQQKLNKDVLLFFNMANPGNRKLDNSLYKQLKVDGLLVQNYDGPGNFVQMVKQSIKWINSNQLRVKRIIMMLPFFSYKNNQGYSTKTAAQELEIDGILHSGFDRGLCKFISETKNSYLVPCYKYFSEVYSVINQKKFSVGYWQGGNGLENYFLFM